MPEKSIHEILKQSFLPATKENWLNAASLEIDGKIPDEALAWTEDELAFLAYYDKNDVSTLCKKNNFPLSPSTDPFLGPRAWINMPGIEVTNEKQANENALLQLAAGADGILFDIRTHTEINFDLLLNQIEWSYCSVSFRTNSNNLVWENLSKYIQQKKYEPALLTGSIFWDDDLQKNNWIDLKLFQLKKIQSCGLIVHASTPVIEISNALVKGVQLLDQITENGTDASTAIQQIAFSIPVSKNFFLEIAKLKALRQLWFQVARTYKLEDYHPNDLHIHIRSEVWKDASFQPNANMLKSTTGSLASVLGGCNSLTVYAEDESLLMNRIARNVSNVLREESYINKVADATSGAYVLDVMIDKIAQASWLNFQQQIRKS